uniref:uncharacterized protein LOC122609858 n=1 Tax=Erigeron canadensis TaxID=72917 RepID=UPI001CB9406E|nr:uncharacterized protein LOC122609858 [Erigeron canadensis]
MAQTVPPVVAPISTTSPPSLKILASNANLLPRRDVLVGAVFGLGIVKGEKSAYAAARRLPPPPQTEKKDPNVSGVLAKIIASKKRKEAMKESITQLREKGKPINELPN